MPDDYFALLGLAPGRYSATEIARRYLELRAALVAQLGDPAEYEPARRRLEQIHLAYSILRDPHQQDRVRQSLEQTDPHTRVRLRIAASLEDGLLRFSRRQEIIAFARTLGISEFHTQLLIAQAQFGIAPAAASEAALVEEARVTDRPRRDARWLWVGACTTALFAVISRWL